MTTEVNKILSEIKAGFNEHKKQVLEEISKPNAEVKYASN